MARQQHACNIGKLLRDRQSIDSQQLHPNGRGKKAENTINYRTINQLINQ
jgi:hypothetical protein